MRYVGNRLRMGLGLTSLFTAVVFAQTPRAQNFSPANGAAVSTDPQEEPRPDRELTRLVRTAIGEDSTLSNSSHNIKVNTQNGRVKLKGVVESDEEKQAIESKAAAFAGPQNVVSELAVER